MEFLILYRIHVVLSLILEKLHHFLKDTEFSDVDDAAALQELDAKYPLTNGWMVYVRERYRSTGYELHVDYVYLLVDSTGNAIPSPVITRLIILRLGVSRITSTDIQKISSNRRPSPDR